MDGKTWYHGGDFRNGKPKGTYVYVTDNRRLAEAHAKPNGTLYCLRSEYNHLVVDHHEDKDQPDGQKRKVIRQADLQKLGGALAAFDALMQAESLSNRSDSVGWSDD